MSDDTAFPLPVLPSLPKDGKEFFNLLMVQIEPELTQENVQSLKKRYEHETEEEHAARMQRYKNALQTYRTQRDEHFARFHEEVKRFSRELAKSAEAAVQRIDQSRFAELESLFAA